jgi:hypothetical protein
MNSAQWSDDGVDGRDAVLLLDGLIEAALDGAAKHHNVGPPYLSAPCGAVFDRLHMTYINECPNVAARGEPQDIPAYTRAALLVDLWDELVLPRAAVRTAGQPPINADGGGGMADKAAIPASGLTRCQLEVAQLFFRVPA